MRACLLTAAAVACLGACAPIAVPDARDLVARMEITLDGFRDRYGFPSATAAILLPDGTIATAATGLADVEAGRAMTPDTPMLGASIGKSLVAATPLALASEGLVSREDLLAAHLGQRGWFAGLPNGDTAGNKNHYAKRAGTARRIPETGVVRALAPSLKKRRNSLTIGRRRKAVQQPDAVSGRVWLLQMVEAATITLPDKAVAYFCL